MNPAGKGYGGRQKLLDNLKQLFRPVAMSRPYNEQIVEVILFSEGFKKAKDWEGNLLLTLLYPCKHAPHNHFCRMYILTSERIL